MNAKIKLFVFLVLMAAALPAGGLAAAAVAVPENARLNARGDGWTCNFRFERRGNLCTPIVVPRNASMGRNSDVWRCNRGYYEIRGICLPKENNPQARKAPLDLKALREAARREMNRGGTDRSDVAAILIALALAGASILLIERRREPAAADYAAAARPHSFRPHRAIAASADAWLSWGERIDGLTGGPVAEAAALTQCPVCQTCYGAESIAVLRRENRGRCLACGSRIHRQPVQTKFQTILETSGEGRRRAALPAR